MPVQPFVSISFRDKAKSVSNTGINISDADAINFVTDQTGAGAEWIAAVAALSLASVIGSQGGITDPAASPTTPTDDNAYNSSKLTVFYHDTVNGRKQRFSIPARDAAHFNTYPASKNVILTVAAGGTAQIETLVTKTQACLSEDGNAILVDQIVISGGRQGG